MGKTQSNLERLYGAVSAQFDIGTFEEFRAKMNTPEDRRRFYDAVDANGFDLGNYDEYERRLGGVQGVSAQGSVGTSETSGQPSSSSAEPSLVKFDSKKEREFQDWFKQVASHKGLDSNPDDPNHLYDYRAFYQAEPELAQQLLTDDPEAHFTDIGKLPGHPTFSDESMHFNESNKNLAGRWDGEIYIPYDPNKPVINALTGEEIPNYPRSQEGQGLAEPSLDTPSPEQIGQAVTDFEAQQIQNAGNQYRDRYVPQDSTVLGGVNIGGEPSVAILDPNAPEGVSNVIPPVDVVASDTMTFQTSVRNTFDNLVNQIKGIDDRLSLVAAESWERLLGKELAASWYEYDGRDINQVKMDAYAELERLESEMKQTQSVSGAIASGDPVAILAASINALSALGGTALASITTGGVGLYTEMMGSAIYDFNKTKAEELGLTVEELYEQGKAEFATPATIGAIGGALERIGFRGAQRAFLSQINSQAGRRLLKAGLGANQEGMTEWLQTGLEAVNERMAEGDANTFDISSVFADALFSEEGLEAYLMGAVGSASASGLGRMGGTISSRVANRDLADNINQGFDTLASIEQDLSNPEISPSTQAVLRGQQDAIVSEISDNIIESTQQEDALPTESKNEVEGLLSRLEELQAVIQDPNVSETTKESLRTQAEQVSGEIDAIISTSQESSAETSVSQEPVDIQETPAQDLSELQAEYDALGRDLQEGRITQEEFDASADLLYGSILLRRDADALEAQMFEERAAQRQIEVDAAISEFQRNNPDIEVDLFEDLPDSVVRTFERVERGIPTDPVALEEASSWLYDKYQSVLDERNNPERRHTIEQLNSIANQIGEDITILENYRYEQQNETESVQPETEASNIPSQPEQEAERVEATGQQESEVTTEAETSPVRDDLSSDEALGQLTAEVSSEAPVETVSDGGVVSGVEQEAAPISVDDVQSEQEQSEVSLPVAERPVRVTDDMPPKQPENARVKSLLRMLPRQDYTEMMGPSNVEYRRDVIEALTGVRPPKKDAGIGKVEKALSDFLGFTPESPIDKDKVRNWANSPDSSPKKSSRPSRQANRYVNSDVSDSVASNPEEVTREFAERTDDPDLIADAYSHVTPREPDYIEEGIANYLGGGSINRRDFNSFGDRNRSSQPLASRWLDASNSQLGLDVMAQELSDQLGVEVTEQDFIDFVEKYRGKDDFEQSRKSAEQEILEDRYRELTGRNLTPRVAESARRRLDAEITDRDLLESSPVFRELGITYEDVLDYEEFHRQSDQGGAENVPSQESVGSTAVADGGARPQGAKAKAKTPKTLLKGIADRLSNTGLAKSVKMMTSEEISEDLDGRTGASVQGQDVNGYVDADGNIVINSDTASPDTPIHEFAHAWERTIETQNPFLHQRGMELIQSEEGKPYVDHVKKTQPSLTGRALYKEALAQAIGDRGARLIESQKNSSIKQWLKDAWDFIAKMVGLSEMSMSYISTLTLNEFADAAAVDLLSGKQFARLENGDTVAKTTAASESRMDDKDKFMSDFMTRMRKRNGINYQGQVDGSLSDGDFSELIMFFNYGTEKGLINGLSDARAAAESMGINSPGQVERAYKISQIRAKSATGFKVSEVSEERIANADFNKVSDREYLAIGKDMVDSGLVKPYDLVNSILTDPRALQPEEVAAMQYYRTQIESDIYDLQKLVDSGSESEVSSFNFNGARGYDGIAAKMEVINQSLFDLDMAILATASQQSAAFRLRSVMADRDFNIVTYLAELKARGYVDPKLEAKLKKLSNELNSVRAKLKRKSKEAEALAEQISQGNIVQEGTQPVRQTRTVRHKKETVEAVNRVLDSLDLDSFALPGMSFQANSTLRFQVNPNPAVSEAVRSAVEKMKLDVSEGRSSLSDALEAAVESVNSVVGEGNWDSVKFRSAVANGLVQNSIPVKVRKPYVNSDGVLIIPGEYLKSLVREGVDTIEKMVSAASAELDGQFSEYDIRNAISGYGRQSASHRTDLDRKISKAKRIANLLSQIEDLETKGERVRTAKQKHDNDTRINNLKDTVRQLEYDLEMTPEERAQYAEQRYNEQRQRYLRNYISQVQERIDNKDFAPVKHRNRYEDDAETTALRKEAESIKNEFKKEKYRHELENRTPGEKFRALAYDILFNITRGLSAGADASAIGVQGAIYTFARPKDAYRIFAGSMKGTFSEQEYQDYFTEMQSDPFYEMARNAGLNLQLPNFYQSVQEEQYKGQLPELMWNKIINDPAAFMVSKFTRKPDSEIRDALYDKANPFTLGDRNYSLVLSKIRFDMFKEFMTNQINKRGVNTEIDTDTIKQVAEIVNTITMASKVPGLQGKLGNDIVSAIMFSARKFIATWKILGAWAPLLMGPSRNTQLFYDSYGGVIGKGLGTMFAMVAIPTAIASWMRFDDDEDDEEPYFYNPYFLDPRHSDFMKLKMGNTRVSLFQGIDGNVIWATRFVTGEYMTSSSRQVRPLNGEQFNKTRLSLTWDYISNKFAPTAGSAVRLLGGDRDRIEGMERFRESLAPMWATGIWEQYQDTGNVAETSALGILGMFGLAYNNYGGAEFASKRGTDNKKAVEIFERSGLSAYDPGRNQRTYFDGEKMSSVSGSLYSDSYLPAYQKYMTEAVLSNEARFSKNVHWEHKEGLIKSMKRDAYKYAEIESSGVYARAGFDKFSIDGVQYKLLESQYSDKAKHIKNYMDKLYKRDIREAKTSVRAKMRSEGIKATPAYIEMQEKLYLYNKASAYANQMLYNDMRRGKMKLFKSTEVTVDTVLDEE